MAKRGKQKNKGKPQAAPQAVQAAVETVEQVAAGEDAPTEQPEPAVLETAESTEMSIAVADEAVQEALKFAKKDKNTLVIVTADHAHSSQIVDEVTPGLSIKLRTNEGSDMVVSYGTAAAGESQQHTGSQVRVAGYGPGAANVVGLIDQTDLFFIIRDGMRAYRR